MIKQKDLWLEVEKDWSLQEIFEYIIDDNY